MPILVVHGVSGNEKQELLSRAYRRLQEAIAGVPEMKVTANRVVVHFLPDLFCRQQGQKIVAFLNLFESSDRTDEALKRVSDKVTESLLENFESAMVSECHPVFISRARSSVCIRSSFIPAPDS
jgi:hypothetical protein